MSLVNALKRALTSAAPFDSGSQTLAAQHGTQHLTCDLIALDSLACSVTNLALQAESLKGISAESLKARARGLAARVTYLLEPISPIEIDEQGCAVQLRSAPPQKDEDGTSYYELLVSRQGEISLRRYARQIGGGRSVIPAHLTREVLLRLTADFSTAAE